MELSLEIPADSAGDTISLSCLTPLRLKYTNELQGSLPFHLIIRAALRRVSSLEAVYGEGEPELDYKGIVARATKVHTSASDCRWIGINFISGWIRFFCPCYSRS